MGREARCDCTWGGKTAAASAHLEAAELIVRGGVKARIARSDMRAVAVDGDALEVRTTAGTLRLMLGAKTAASWAKALAQAPPSLAKKLGVGPAAKAFVVGAVRDAALVEALDGARTRSLAQAAVVLGEATSPADLARLIEKAAESAGAPIWCVYPKGKASPLPEATVRAAMHAAGYVDTKVASVSETMTAARFSPRA